MNKRALTMICQLGLALLLAACGASPAATSVPTAPPTSAPTAQPSPVPPTATAEPRLAAGPVTFKTADGETLEGQIYGRGDTAVVLAHMMPGNEGDWRPFAERLAAQDFTALTFTFRAAARPTTYFDSSAYGKDVQAALQFLRDHGYTEIVCVGASRGAAACHDASADEELAGLVNLSGASSLVMAKSEAYPKLFVGTKSDPYTSIVKIMYDGAVEPKALHVLPGGEHGTEMFDTANKAELEQLLLDFLTGIRG